MSQYMEVSLKESFSFLAKNTGYLDKTGAAAATSLPPTHVTTAVLGYVFSLFFFLSFNVALSQHFESLSAFCFSDLFHEVNRYDFAAAAESNLIWFPSLLSLFLLVVGVQGCALK